MHVDFTVINFYHPYRKACRIVRKKADDDPLTKPTFLITYENELQSNPSQLTIVGLQSNPSSLA